MSEFTNTNPYSEYFSEKITNMIIDFENDFREKVKSNNYVDTKVAFNELFNSIYKIYSEEDGTDSYFHIQLGGFVKTFNLRNMEYILDNFCNDITDIIEISLDEFESIPTKDDFDLLNKENDNEEQEETQTQTQTQIENEEPTDLEKIYAILNSVKRFNTKDNLDIKNIIIYLLKFSILRKKIIKELKNDMSSFKENLESFGLDKLDEKFVTEQIFKTIEKDKDIENIIKNNTYYSHKYFREYNK
jgi:hypothetical protein